MCVSDDTQIIFSDDAGEITLPRFNADSFSVKDMIEDKGPTANFTAQILPGEPFPRTESLCLIREISGSGFDHIFTGYYQIHAVEAKGYANEWSFSVANLINYTNRDIIWGYSLTRSLTDHINLALEESGGFIPGNDLSLLTLQTIAGDDGTAFPFEFLDPGSMEKFMDAIMDGRGRWKCRPIPFVDIATKTTGTLGAIQVILTGATTNKATPSILDAGGEHCGDPDYLQVIGTVKEQRGPIPANRFLGLGRNFRKPPVII